MMADWYGDVFPAALLAGSKSTEMHFETARNGYRRAVSAESSTTGFGADLVIADDLVSADDARNRKVHQDRTDFVFHSLLTRLNNPNEGQLILIGQRLATGDAMEQVADRLDVEIDALPAIAQIDRSYPIGPGKSHLYTAGCVLHEAQLNRSELDARQRSMGRDFPAHYLQDPSPDGGGALDFAKFGRFDEAPPNLLVFLSIDVARTPGGGDYTVVMKVGYADERYYVLDVARVRFDITQVIRFVHSRIRSERPAGIVIETADGSGDAVYRTLQNEHRVKNLLPYRPRKSKEDRVYEVYPMIQAGDVYLPRSAEWLSDFRNEFVAFPAGKHDDQLDALSQFLRRANELVRQAGGVRPDKYFCDTPVYRLWPVEAGRLVRYS